MKQRFTKLLLLFVIPISHSLSGLAQATKLTNISYGSFSAFGGMHPQGSTLYFVGRHAADTYEWTKLDLGNNNPAINTTILTNDHYRATSGTIVTGITRIGNNVFSCYAKPTNVQDLEFSRFNIEAATEQWVDVYPGSGGTTYSYPSNFNLDASTNRVYFGANPGIGFQIMYWSPTDNSITRLTNISGGISQPSNGNLSFLGDTIYTAASINSYSGFIKIHKNNGGYVFYNLSGISSPRYFTVVNNKIFFAARTSTAGAALTGNEPYNIYVYTPANGSFAKLTNYTTETIADGNLSSFTLTPDKSTLFVNVSYYNTSPVQGSFLTVNTNTNVVTDRSGPTLTDRNTYLYCLNNFVYVTRISGATRSIYKINLTDNTSTLLTGTQFTAIGAITDGSNGSIYMSATEPAYGSEVYSLNLSTDAFTRLTDINTAGNSAPSGFLPYGSNLYFIASATGTASPDNEIYSLPIAMVLPLQMLLFTAAPASNGEVQLSWKVAEQHAIKRFFVERSTDGTTWTTITSLAATSSTAYQYLDKSKTEAVVYYRIKEESADGTFAFSDTKKILNAVKAKSFMLAANPAVNKTITVRFSAAAKAGSISITDEAGHVVVSKKWNGGAGTIQIPIVATGMYVVGYNKEIERVVVN